MSNKYRDPELTYITLGECGKILRETNKLYEQDDIIIFKIEYKYPYFKIPIIEYNLFGLYGLRRLGLNACKNIKVNYFIPKLINNYEDYKYNPKNNYYYDICNPSSKEEITDLTLRDKKELFNNNNMSLCESICVYKGYVNNQIICECKIKHKFNFFFEC